MAVAATGAEVGILGGQGRRLDSEDGVCRGILRGDGGAALALADKRTLRRSAHTSADHGRAHLGVGAIFARQLLQVGELLFRSQVGVVGHGEGGRAAVLVEVLVVASVLVVVKARGREDRGAHW